MRQVCSVSECASAQCDRAARTHCKPGHPSRSRSPSSLCNEVIELSVIVPAFNEAKLLAQTLAKLREALLGSGLCEEAFEIIVCDNASTDATPDIARAHGAHVVTEPHRQIARARNTGARAGTGRFLLFVDADTWPSPALLAKAVTWLREGRVIGGGALIDASDQPLWVKCLVGVWNTIARTRRIACGAFVFCDAHAFRAVGGFDESLYAAEELALSGSLARHARSQQREFRIITTYRLKTSMRKLELYSFGDVLTMLLGGLRHPLRILKDPRHLRAWYDGRR